MAKTSDKVRNMYQTADNYQRKEWLEKATANRNFFLGDQLTKDERDSLQQAGMPDFTVNKITPAVQLYKYFATARNPRWKAVGREESDTEVAHRHEKLNEYCWDLSKGQAVTGQVIQDCLVQGTGFFHVDVNRDMDNGMGEVIFEQLDPDEVFVDPNSRDFLWRDADFIGIRKVLPKKKLKDKYPSRKQTIKKAGSYDTTLDTYGEDYEEKDYIAKQIERFNGKDDIDFAEYFEIYVKEKEPYVNVFYIDKLPKKKQLQLQDKVREQVEQFSKESRVRLSEQLDELEKAFKMQKINEERYNLEVEKAKKANKKRIRQFRAAKVKQLKKEMGKLKSKVMHKKEYKEWKEIPELSKDVVEAINFYKNRIKLHIVVGDKHLDTYYYEENVSEFPIVPVHYIKDGAPYGLSFVELLKDKQREINKAHQVAIHNANLGTALRWIYRRGTIDEELWEDYSSSAGALLPHDAEQGEEPHPVTIPNISNGFIELTQATKAEMDDLSGMIAPSNLKEEDTFKGMLVQDEYGTRRVKQWMKNCFDPAMEQVGKVFKQIAQTVYSAYKVFRISEHNHAMAFEQDVEITEFELNKRIYNSAGKLKKVKWDYPESRFDVKYVTGSTMPVNRWAKMQMYFKYYEAGLIDDIAFLRMTDIEGKDKILERNSMYKKMQKKLQGQEESIKQLKSVKENLERQLVRSGIKSKVDDYSKQQEQELEDTKNKQSLYRRDMDRQKVAQQKEMARTIADFKSDLKNMLKEIKLEYKEKMQKQKD